MDVFRSDRIRNVVLLGHGGSGKTSLVEAMAYLSGITNRLGKVTDGNTVSDYDKEEIKRKFSITTSVVPIEWGKVKLNVLDTPGYSTSWGSRRSSGSSRCSNYRCFRKSRGSGRNTKSMGDVRKI